MSGDILSRSLARSILKLARTFDRHSALKSLLVNPITTGQTQVSGIDFLYPPSSGDNDADPESVLLAAQLQKESTSSMGSLCNAFLRQNLYYKNSALVASCVKCNTAPNHHKFGLAQRGLPMFYVPGSLKGLPDAPGGTLTEFVRSQMDLNTRLLEAEQDEKARKTARHEQIDVGFQAIRFLSGVLSSGRKYGLAPSSSTSSSSSSGGGLSVPQRISGLQVADRLAPGVLLVAHPMLPGNVFGRSVILVTNVSEAGTTGVIINKPTTIMGKSVIRDLKSEFSNCKLNYGGPSSEVHVLLAVDETEAAPNPSLGGLTSEKDRVLRTGGSALYVSRQSSLLQASADKKESGVVAKEQNKDVDRLRVLHGSCTWEPHQLECELLEGSWIMVDIQEEDHIEEGCSLIDAVFNLSSDTDAEHNTWKRVLRSLQGEFQSFALHPADECVVLVE